VKGSGFSVTLDSTAKVLDNLVGARGYVNQISQDTNIPVSVPKIRWLPGALAAVLAKGTIQTVQQPGDGGDSPGSLSIAARFVESGVTGFAGYISDPTTDGYVRPHILFPAYVAGCNLAEAFYAASRYLAWREVIIGDPLASPYAGNSARRRESEAGAFRNSIDAETGLPEYFARRRQLYLVRKYNTSKEAAVLLLKAESATARGEYVIAARLVDQSLTQDPLVPEAHLLKAELQERRGEFMAAFDSYKKALGLGWGGRDIYEKLARTAFIKLADPGKAEPYAAWLYQRFGRTEPDLGALYAEVKLRAGKTDDAASLLTRLVRGQPQPPAFALAALGRIALEKGNLDLARDYLARALNRANATDDPSNPAAAFIGRVDKAEIRKLLDQAESKPRQVETAPPPVIPAETGTSGSVDSFPAQVRSRTPIPYPGHARAAGIQGVVVVDLLIDEMGQLMKVDSVRGNRLLAEEVLKSVRSWRFAPKMENGRAMAGRITLPIVFRPDKPYAEQ
jgi:TonB family protein